MKPCDCKDNNGISKLREGGIAFNDNRITVEPPLVVLRVGMCSASISQIMFKQFAEWYLEDQGNDRML